MREIGRHGVHAGPPDSSRSDTASPRQFARYVVQIFEAIGFADKQLREVSVVFNQVTESGAIRGGKMECGERPVRFNTFSIGHVSVLLKRSGDCLRNNIKASLMASIDGAITTSTLTIWRF
jgi:hypothetical protein